METTIARIGWEFIRKATESMATGSSFSEIERRVMKDVKHCAAELMGTYLVHVDQAIAKDKHSRRQAGYTIERKGDKRNLLTSFGEVIYNRTYYQRDSGGYEYLVDTTLGIDHYMRISEVVGLELANAARDMSYAKASHYIGNETISRQTVMSRVRESIVVKHTESIPLRKVSELHIDADEDHVALRNGKKTEVPLISVYEGIGHQGKRNFCKGIFHVSEYGKTSDDLWEQVGFEITKRYDLTNTQLYLHGDGAPWIRTGLEWLPGAKFVLDKYHKNKAITAMTAGLDNHRRTKAEHRIRKALNEEDLEYFALIRDNLCQEIPERTEIIQQQAEYLQRFIKGISICARDPGANNGGCTEPHVSHVLSVRLSSRPMAWSKKTLEKLAPVLAAGRVTSVGEAKIESPKSPPKSLRRTAAKASKAYLKYTLGLPTPEAIGVLPITGRVTGLQVILKGYAG